MYKKRTADMSQSTSGGFYIRYRNEKYRKIQRVYQIQTCWFLICDKDLHIKAGLELDDSSHETRQAAQTDKFKNELFESIGLPLFRIKTIRSEYERQIDKMISQIRRMR